MGTESIPLGLFKANIELQLRIARLVSESGHRWLQAVQQASAEGVSEASTEIEGLLRAGDWQALAMLPSQAFWRLFQDRVGDAKGASDIAIQNQEAFVIGLQQALESWQQAVAETVRTEGGTQLPPLPLQNLFQQWAMAWIPGGAPAAKKSE